MAAEETMNSTMTNGLCFWCSVAQERELSWKSKHTTQGSFRFSGAWTARTVQITVNTIEQNYLTAKTIDAINFLLTFCTP